MPGESNMLQTLSSRLDYLERYYGNRVRIRQIIIQDKGLVFYINGKRYSYKLEGTPTNELCYSIIHQDVWEVIKNSEH
jgi:hypothetical protein